jgi:hypothetical protein
MSRPILEDRILPPSLLNFFAGVLAGAGINLLTAAETGPTGVASYKIVADSAAWMAASMFAAWTAHISDRAERKADLAMMNENFTAEEKEAISESEAAKVSRRFWRLIAVTAGWVLVAILLIPSLAL